ncbi:MAG: amino acid adenylation domain-containing protein, partial [Lysobacter sp.]|nr:amino acid adenylation domain-containing protein [Lysobacter sp.]
YLGQFDQTFDAESLFQFAPESAGTDIDPERPRDQPLELNGMVALGRLQFDLSYSSEQFGRQNIETLARYIEDGLRSVIEHCAPGDDATATARRADGVLTPSDFPLARVTAEQLNEWQSRYDIENIYPATSMQQGMLFHTMLDAGAYVSQIYPTFTGVLDADLFRQAWQSVVDRHDIFRTVFVGDGEQLHQLVVKTAGIPWREEDLRGSTEAEQERRFEEFRLQDKALGFDVAQAPMQRICVFRLEEDRFKVLWSSHHMLLDGWSTPLVYRDVMATYQASLRGESARLPAAAPYSNYIAWLVAQDRNAAAEYWRDHLANLRHPTPLVLDHLPGDGKRGNQSCSVQLSREASDKLQAFAKRSHTTVNTLMQLAWGLLLHRYSGETDVVFGATISGRPAAVTDVESMVGLFINTIPVRISFEQTDTAQLPSALHQSFQLSNDFGYLPLTQIQSHSQIANAMPLFDSLIAFENFPIDAAADASAKASDRGLTMDGLGADEHTNYKITLVATMQDILSISCRYRAEDFSESAVERMLEQLVSFLTQLPNADSIDTIQLPDDEFHAQVRAAAETAALARHAYDAARRAGVDAEVRPVVSPRSRTESDMLEIWQDILGTGIDSIRDNFFDLGGNSLKAMRVASHVAAHFGVERSLKALFVHNTIESLSRHVDEQKQVARERIPVVDKGSALPLSLCQQPLWVLDQMNGGSAQYNMPVALRLRGELDREALRGSLEKIVERHSVLRTVFVRTEAEPVQMILPPGPLDMPVLDLSDLGDAAREEAVAAHIREEAFTAFDLGRDRLLRVRLLDLGERDHVLLLTMHHIASDGWSIGILTSEFVALYAARREGREATLPELEIQYADYAHWQRSTLSDEIERQWQHWERVLRGAPTLHSLLLDKPRPAQQKFDGAVHNQVIGRDVLSALVALGKRHDATLFMVLQSAFALLLSRWSGEEDIVLGSPVAGRPHKQLEGLIGFFVNTVVFRYRLAPDKAFTQLLDESRQQAIEAFANQDIPLDVLVDRLQPERSMSHNPLVQVMFSLQNQDMGDLRLEGLEIEGVGQAMPVTKFDLDLAARELNGELLLMWRYATSLFDAATIERMAGSFDILLRAIASEPERPLLELPLLEAPARRQLLESFNDTVADYQSESLIQTLFEAQAAANPQAEAVACETQSLSYGELNARANALANHLIAIGVKPDDRVGLCIERSVEMVVGLMGILKAGAAYVPLDPGYPTARLAWMLQDSAPVAVVAHMASRERLAGATVPVLCLDEASTRDALARQPTGNPDARALGMTSANLAYVIYTSGPSGIPKGVMIEHRSVLNLWSALDRHLHTAELPARRVALNASIASDASVRSLTQLLSGACVVLIPQEICSNGEQLLRYLVQQRVQLLDCTPTQIQLLVAAGFLDADSQGECRQVLVGGEPIPQTLAERLAGASCMRFFNVYGPTECTVDSTLGVVDPAHHGHNIGRPLDNTRIYILDENGEPVPIGVSGELCIGGAGVARGYLDRPEMTAERFIEDPFDPAIGARMYRTGDLGRWLADGTIEYLGRNHGQVTVRGFRIELGEIEARLAACDGVQEAAVAARDNLGGEKVLVAYVVMVPGRTLDTTDMRARLAVNLPEYMIPGIFVDIMSMPKTPSGKLDRKALPAPGAEGSGNQAYEAPCGEREETLARVWQELFGRERVGRNDNFFDIGGNSIRAIQTVIKANKAGLDIKVGDMFKLQTVHAICGALESATTEATVATDTTPTPAESEIASLSPYQRSVLETGPAQAGCRSTQFDVGPDVTETHFRQLVKELLTRHESSLAVVIEKGDGYRIKPVEMTRALLRTVVDIHDLTGLQADTIAARRDAARVLQEDALSSLDGPLLRVALFVGDTSTSVVLSAHCALLDDAQWQMLSDEFRSACAGAMHRQIVEQHGHR